MKDHDTSLVIKVELVNVATTGNKSVTVIYW